MRLAEKFTFRCTDSGDTGILFTATRSGDEYTVTHKWLHDDSEAHPFNMEEQELRECIVNATYTVKEILSGSPASAQRSGSRYLLQTFTFRVAGGNTTYTANLSDGRYLVTYPSMSNLAEPSEFSVDTVQQYISDDLWVDVEKVKAEVPQPEPIPEFTPYVLGDEIRVRHVESEVEYTLKRDRGDGDYSIYYADGVEKINTVPYYADEMNEWFGAGKWVLLENSVNTIDGNLLVSGSVTGSHIDFGSHYETFPVEAEDLDLLPEAVFDCSTALAHVRDFVTQNPGWRVEIDADFYTVQSEAYEGTRFVVKDEGELAAVFQAIRTLNEFSDKG